ncbi:hypothetical protein KC867_00025 [Candidatus Saccharibacteria bacterium]|nr:hypothetical protein [Candidatus Saccharibacteria bacterium]
MESKEELIALQSRAYRNLTSEKIADNFAANVFKINPQLKQAMMNNNLGNTTSSASAEHSESSLLEVDGLTPEQKQRKRWQENTDIAVKALEQRGVTPEQARLEANELIQNLTERIRQIHEQASQEGRSLTNSEKGLAAGLKQTIDVQNRISAVFQARHGHKDT